MADPTKRLKSALKRVKRQTQDSEARISAQLDVLSAQIERLINILQGDDDTPEGPTADFVEIDEFNKIIKEAAAKGEDTTLEITDYEYVASLISEDDEPSHYYVNYEIAIYCPALNIGTTEDRIVFNFMKDPEDDAYGIGIDPKCNDANEAFDSILSNAETVSGYEELVAEAADRLDALLEEQGVWSMPEAEEDEDEAEAEEEGKDAGKGEA